MEELQLPTAIEVMSFGFEHNLNVCEKHLARFADPSQLDAVLQMCRTESGKLSRQDVFDMAETSRSWESLLRKIVYFAGINFR